MHESLPVLRPLGSSPVPVEHACAQQMSVLQANTAPLQLLCASQVLAQGITVAAGQAAAIPSSFGAHPCNLFQGALPRLPAAACMLMQARAMMTDTYFQCT